MIDDQFFWGGHFQSFELSLYWTRSKTRTHLLYRTAGGERLLKVWLRQPLTDTQKINERLGKLKQTLDSHCLYKFPHILMLVYFRDSTKCDKVSKNVLTSGLSLFTDIFLMFREFVPDNCLSVEATAI